jgi:hypothetical protein
MTTAYVINRKVNSMALLPHRDTISIMFASPLYGGATVHFRTAALHAAGLKTR